MVYLVHLQHVGLYDVVLHQLKVGVADPGNSTWLGDWAGLTIHPRGWLQGWLSSAYQCSTFLRRPVKKLSMTVTSCPSFISTSARCDPTNPSKRGQTLTIVTASAPARTQLQNSCSQRNLLTRATRDKDALAVELVAVLNSRILLAA